MDGWYLEKYDLDGKRIEGRDGYSFKTVRTAVMELAAGETARFIAPVHAEREQIIALQALGAELACG